MFKNNNELFLAEGYRSCGPALGELFSRALNGRPI